MRGWIGLAAAVAVVGVLLPCSQTHAAIRPHAFTLTPAAGAFFFDNDEDLKTSSVFTLGIGYSFTKNWTGEVVTGYIDSRSDADGKDEIDGYPLRLDVLYHFRPEKRLIPYLAAGFGGLWLEDPGGSTEVDALFGYGAGLRVFLTESVAVRADVRHFYRLDTLWLEGEGQHNFTVGAGLAFQIGGDIEPPPQVDTDGDGVIDVFDRCPDTRLGVPVNGFGCPADLDGDGIYDYLDRCPGTPSGVKVNKEGCPPDGDRDGVPDFRDKCPDTSLGHPVDERGCPVTDRDGDGVPDSKDKCPETSSGVSVDASGCPSAVPDRDKVLPFQGEEELSLFLEFAPGQAEIKPDFKAELDRAANFIRSNPDRRIVVEGHTDSVGPAQVNLELSRRRAENVREYLLKTTGADPERIQATGYGETRPMASNATQEGRLRNRRVIIRAAADGG